jgi:general L-amino acid transport system permease protein
MRRNLFNNLVNSVLTIVSLVLLYFIGRAVFEWVFFVADWRPIYNNPLIFMVGQYPRDQLWRVGAGLVMVSLLTGISWGQWRGIMRSFANLLAAGFAILAVLPVGGLMGTLAFRIFFLSNVAVIYLGFLLGSRPFINARWVLIGWLLSLIVIPMLLRGWGVDSPLPTVDTTLWGGLLVTLLLAVGGILLSFPIGVLLALGRRSALPIIRIFCTALIEMVRGVPLITILFMSSIILALFLPPELRIDRLV